MACKLHTTKLHSSNILSMEMDTNPNSEVAKTITCIKYIKNMRSDFSLLYKCLAGNANGNSSQVEELHYDATSNNGKEITNVILGVLTKNKKLRTICLASDII